MSNEDEQGEQASGQEMMSDEQREKMQQKNPGVIFKLGPMEDKHIDEISRNAGADNSEVQKDIRERAQGNPGASNVLGQLASRGNEIYDSVAPNLGNGSEIWLKYSDECGEDLDALIEKYGK